MEYKIYCPICREEIKDFSNEPFCSKQCEDEYAIENDLSYQLYSEW